MRTKRPVIVFGEVLCDMFPPRPGVALREAEVFVPQIGGAPANVAAQVAWQGWPCAIISAVGTDPISQRVTTLLANRGVDVQYVREKPGTRTGLILIEIDDEGERHFFPWREGSADEQLTASDLPVAAIEGAAAFHHGTVTLRAEPVASTNRKAVAIARKAGVMVSVDVNLRPKMYDNAAVLYQRARNAVIEADVVKASREEALHLLGSGAEEDLAGALLSLGPSLVLLTDGGLPCTLATQRARVTLDPPPVEVVDTTGAGDAFTGAALAWICEAGARREDLASLDEGALSALGHHALAVGSRAVTAIGALGAFTSNVD